MDLPLSSCEVRPFSVRLNFVGTFSIIDPSVAIVLFPLLRRTHTQHNTRQDANRQGEGTQQIYRKDGARWGAAVETKGKTHSKMSHTAKLDVVNKELLQHNPFK